MAVQVVNDWTKHLQFTNQNQIHIL